MVNNDNSSGDFPHGKNICPFIDEESLMVMVRWVFYPDQMQDGAPQL